jgi:uncharacterized protein YmfQ (DUF2313 family)
MTVAKIVKLSKQLYPTGRAFKMPTGGVFEKLNYALAISENQAYEDAKSILNSLLPDNDGFTADDASSWERRLGLVTSDGVSLADRKLAIQRKFNYPGSIAPRGHYLFLERQLRAAGFDVYVFENRFAAYPDTYETMSPDELDPSGLSEFQHGDFQHGDQQHGSHWGNIVANSIDEETDSHFDVGDNLRSTFFVGGSPVGSFANVAEGRKDEFRQLILRLKPVQTVGYLFINYV